ncbi:hypothetical protein AWH56_008755 [Anaerobacillus isosaccharinicus]|uniref:Uncharacterized protein n=1 Tax=Anaerobacillus isosaccharinicus TaxID=1532552 RepID=A0A1S2L129_9BACI|nr:hypothetical protein [Anaerobacillus isosaccharinicus]MBA5588937.1 hypothetical protein [Anaerobacillus isosaccharinicus]QOY37653.1 hypothetical protein AWH56_008755 [Anaerobacillus isosaccharinicus]
MQELSPFSAYHKWKMQWRTVSSVEHAHNLALYRLSRSRKDREMINSISKIGLIGGVQLSRMFLKGDKKRLKELYRTRVLKKHILHKGKNEIEVYTLGKTSLDFLKSNQGNRWFGYSETDVLQRMVYFQLYEKMQNELNVNIEIEKAPYPFAGRMIIKGNSFLVLVVRENTSEILKHLEKVAPSEKIICVCEHIVYMKELNDKIKHLSVRLTTDKDIRESALQDTFYVFEQGEWKKESQKKKLKISVQ